MSEVGCGKRSAGTPGYANFSIYNKSDHIVVWRACFITQSPLCCEMPSAFFGWVCELADRNTGLFDFSRGATVGITLRVMEGRCTFAALFESELGATKIPSYG